MKTNIILILALTLLTSCFDGKHQLYSPDKALRVEVILPADENQNTLQFNIYKNDSLISGNNILGLKLNSELQEFHQNIRVLSFRQFFIDNLIEAADNTSKNQANGIRFMTANLDGKNMDVVFRIYNDAVAFQYELYNDSLDVLLKEYSQLSIDSIKGINAHALADSLLLAPSITIEHNQALINISGSESTPLPPRYVMPWRYLSIKAGSGNTRSIEERLLAKTAFAY